MLTEISSRGLLSSNRAIFANVPAIRLTKFLAGLVTAKLLSKLLSWETFSYFNMGRTYFGNAEMAFRTCVFFSSLKYSIIDWDLFRIFMGISPQIRQILSKEINPFWRLESHFEPDVFLDYHGKPSPYCTSCKFCNKCISLLSVQGWWKLWLN